MSLSFFDEAFEGAGEPVTVGAWGLEVSLSFFEELAIGLGTGGRLYRKPLAPCGSLAGWRCARIRHVAARARLASVRALAVALVGCLLWASTAPGASALVPFRYEEPDLDVGDDWIPVDRDPDQAVAFQQELDDLGSGEGGGGSSTGDGDDQETAPSEPAVTVPEAVTMGPGTRTTGARAGTGVDPGTAVRVADGPGEPAPSVRDPLRSAPPLAVTLAGLGVGAAAAFVLYRRLRRDELLENDLRARIVEIVRDEPGVHATELSDRLDVALNTVLYHGRILAEYDLLVPRKAGRRVIYFDPSDGGSAASARALLWSGAKRDLVELVLEEPGIGVSEAARRLDLAPSTVSHHVRELLEAEVLRDGGEGRSRALEPTERVPRALS